MKRKFLISIMAFFLTLIVMTPSIYAIDVDAKAFGMGGSFTAISNDASSIYWNPAGLTDINYVSFKPSLGIYSPDGISWSTLNEIINGGTFTAPEDVDMDMVGLIGLATSNYGAGVMASGSVAFREYNSTEVEGNGEYILSYTLSNARKINSPKWNLGAISVGVNLKVVDGRKHGYSITYTGDPQNCPVERVTCKGTGYSADIGIRLKLTDAITFGLIARDLVGSITWSDVTTTSTRNMETGEEVALSSSTSLRRESMGSRIRGGIGVDIPYLKGIIAADIEDDGTLHMGFEKRFLFNGLAIRGGREIRSNGLRFTTIGAGVNLGPISVDAALRGIDFFKGQLAAVISGKVTF